MRTSSLARPPQTNAPYTQAAEQFLDSRTRYGGAFAQDSWKVTPNLTLNLGLRWEVSMPWYDTQGQNSDLQSRATVYGVSAFSYRLGIPWRCRHSQDLGPHYVQ